MSLPDAVLWDMDGTLVDTEPYWIAAEHEIVEGAGGRWSQEYAHQLVGNDLRVSAAFIRDHSPIDWDVDRIIEELLVRVIARVRAHVPWRPGARDLLTGLADAGVPCALVTMSWRSLADAVLDALPEGTFGTVVTGDSVEHGKPHPEPYLAAASALGAAPERCVAIEDSPTGVRSAVAAGVRTVAVPHVIPIPPVDGAVQVPTLLGVSAEALAELAGIPDPAGG